MKPTDTVKQIQETIFNTIYKQLSEGGGIADIQKSINSLTSATFSTSKMAAIEDEEYAYKTSLMLANIVVTLIHSIASAALVRASEADYFSIRNDAIEALNRIGKGLMDQAKKAEGEGS